MNTQALEPSKTAPAAPPNASAADGEVTRFKGEIDILYKMQLPHLDCGPAKAYSARSSKAGGNNTHFALISDPSLLPRQRAASKMAAIINPSLARLIGAGIVYWPPAGAQRYAFIYENTMGVPLVKPENKGGMGWKPERVIATVVKPMISVLLDLRDKDLVHGNIRAENMFVSGSAGNERVALGDCLSTPPGLLQPALYEPLERALADPLARGQGSFEDDLYAFGVTLCFMLRTRDPLEGLTEQQVIQQKMELGSYAALTGKERFSGGILELLRGLLYDDRAQRWTLDEIEAWDQGQRLSPKQTVRKIKAARPLHFNDERYFRPVQLAMDLTKNPTEAVQMIDSDTLGQWVARSLEDKEAAARLEVAIESAQENGRGPGYADRLLSRVSIALDPEAPVRYAGMRLHPEGLPYVLAETAVKKKNLSVLGDILSQTLIMYWLQNQTDVRLDIGGLIARYDGARSFLRQTQMGYGMERCIYSLCPEIHCLSEHLVKYMVLSPEDLMYALEDMSAQSGKPDLVVDRHISAFLSVRDRRMVDPFLTELNAPERYKKVMANIKVLATIQKRSRMDMFPGITQWMVGALDPVYERFHDRELREAIRRKVEKIKDSGDISKIVSLFDNVQTAQQDFNDFRKAMREYHELRDEHSLLEHKMNKTKSYGRDTGREVAAIVSGVLAGILILAFAFLHFVKGGAF